MQLYLDGAEQFAERWCGRTFSPDPPIDPELGDVAPAVTKYRSARGKRFVRVPDLRVATSVVLDGVTLTDYFIDSYVTPATHIELASTTTGRGELAITGRWGFSPPPDDAKIAILQLAARGWSRRDARWSDTVQTPDGAVFFYSRNMPDEVANVFRSYRIPNLAVV
jgi:hypothetical protein